MSAPAPKALPPASTNGTPAPPARRKPSKANPLVQNRRKPIAKRPLSTSRAEALKNIDKDPEGRQHLAKQTPATGQQPGRDGSAVFAQAPRSPTPEGEPTEYPVFMTKNGLVAGLRHHVARLQGKGAVDIRDEKVFTRPLKLHRRDAVSHSINPEEVAKEEAKDAMEEKEKERIEAAKAERLRQREEQAKLIAPSVGTNKPKPFQFKKKTEQVHRATDSAEHLKKSQLRYEEALPWHLEDFDNKHTWVGSYEATLSDTNVMLVLEDDHFRVIPLEKWYRFREKGKFRQIDPEQAEKLMKAKTKEPRWIMEAQKQQQLKKIMQKEAKKATGLFMRSGEREEKGTRMDVGEEPAPDADEIDFNDGELFDDDDENPLFEGDEEDQKDAEAKIKREQRNANFFDMADEKEVEEEEERKKKLEELHKELEKGTRKALLRREKNYDYEDDSDDENPYTSASDDEDSDNSNAQSQDQKPGDKTRPNGEKSGTSTKGENTPSNRRRLDGHHGKHTGLKRPGSPNLSEASDNELSRKKTKLTVKMNRRPGSPDMSGASGNESTRKKHKIKGDSALARQASLNSTARGAGSGSESDVPLRVKQKTNLGASARGTPASSRAQSPAAGTGTNAPSPAGASSQPYALPPEADIIAAIPPEGILVNELASKFRDRIPKNASKDFIILVRRITHYNHTTKYLTRKTT